MANVKISELTALTPPDAADLVPVTDSSASQTKRTTVGEIVGIINGDVDVANDGTATISELPVSKLQDGDARQLLQTDAAGTGVEWTSNVDVPGTLDVTGATTLDSTLGVNGQSTLASAAVSDLTSGRVVLAGTSGELEDSAGLTFNGTQLDVDGDVVITGDLTVEGSSTVLETQTVTVEDKNIELGVVASPTDVTADNGGITLKGATDKTINWVNATDAWTFSEHVDIASAKEYRIAGTKVLDATSLGSAVVSSSLTSVGTIATGVWEGTAIDAAYLDSTVVTTGDSGTVTSTMIENGTIVNADVNASAAIDGSKITPNFGSQTIQTTGVVNAGSGIESAPSLTVGTTDNGFYSPNTDEVGTVTNGTERIRTKNNGDTSIFGAADVLFLASSGAASTGLNLTVGKHSATGTFTGTVSYVVRTNGDILNTNNSYGPLSSDERLKQDITDANSQWDDIKNIRITNFRYKNDPAGQLQLGPIAQELETACPGLIIRRLASEEEIADPSNNLADGDEVLSFKASILYMKAVKALQEAIERIENLEAKVSALESA